MNNGGVTPNEQLKCLLDSIKESISLIEARGEYPAEMGIVESNILNHCIQMILLGLGEDSEREGLLATPYRVVKSWERIYGGYKQDPESILDPVFTEKHDQMVILRNIEFYSTCEHHMLPFFGKCHIGYIPGRIVTFAQGDEGYESMVATNNYRVVGVSKLARLVECFARRLQIQERMVEQIAESINDVLEPQGVAVVAEAQHFCMTSRGVEKQQSQMVTSCMLGVFRDNQAAREEFLKLCGM